MINILYIDKNLEEARQVLGQRSESYSISYLSHLDTIIKNLISSPCEFILLNHENYEPGSLTKVLSMLIEFTPYIKVIETKKFKSLSDIKQKLIEYNSYEIKLKVEEIKSRMAVILKETDQVVLSEIIKLYLSRENLIMNELPKIYKANQFNNLELNIHNLKSSSANLGANRLAEICLFIETYLQQNKNKRSEVVDIGLNAVRSEYFVIIEILKQIQF